MKYKIYNKEIRRVEKMVMSLAACFRQ